MKISTYVHDILRVRTLTFFVVASSTTDSAMRCNAIHDVLELEGNNKKIE